MDVNPFVKPLTLVEEILLYCFFFTIVGEKRERQRKELVLAKFNSLLPCTAIASSLLCTSPVLCKASKQWRMSGTPLALLETHAQVIFALLEIRYNILSLQDVSCLCTHKWPCGPNKFITIKWGLLLTQQPFFLHLSQN